MKSIKACSRAPLLSWTQSSTSHIALNLEMMGMLDVVLRDPSVPLIDFAGVDGKQREAIAQQVARACDDWGFFQLVNHGLDQKSMAMAKQVSRQVFDLPEDEKMKIKIGPDVVQGWNHPKLLGQLGENFNLSTKETAEYLFLVQLPAHARMEAQYPSEPTQYRSTIIDYAETTRILFFDILDLLMEQLGLSPETGRRAISEPRVSMRTNFYPLGEKEQPTGYCQAHTDKGYLTLLLADDASGLEVKKDGRWFSVDPVPGAIIVNVGDALEVFSNGKYKSVEHRGMPNPDKERLTIATFFGPEFFDEIGPLAEILDVNNPPLYRRCIFGEYIKAFLKEGLIGKTDSLKLKS